MIYDYYVLIMFYCRTVGLSEVEFVVRWLSSPLASHVSDSRPSQLWARPILSWPYTLVSATARDFSFRTLLLRNPLDQSQLSNLSLVITKKGNLPPLLH